nr:MerR family transcriptional regulator [Melioribacteraceae bacterium]
MKNKYNIKAVCKITGISEHTIRAWERRYSSVTPERTETNRRVYSENDIEKLSLLFEAVKNGYTISNISDHTTSKLRLLLNKIVEPSKNQEIIANQYFQNLIVESISLISKFKRNEFEKLLLQISVDYSKHQMLIEFIIPLLDKIGVLWETGKIRVIHEHFAVSVLRTFLGNLIESNPNHENAPKIITTTLEGFTHELGALIAALYAMDFGWEPIFLGANLPPEEITAAVNENNAKAVLLSLVYPGDDPHAGNQLRKLRKYLGNAFPIILTGYSAKS